VSLSEPDQARPIPRLDEQVNIILPSTSIGLPSGRVLDRESVGGRCPGLSCHIIPEFAKRERENRVAEYPMSRRHVLEEWNLKYVIYAIFSPFLKCKIRVFSCTSVFCRTKDLQCV
jgi:hypothetical protein